MKEEETKDLNQEVQEQGQQNVSGENADTPSSDPSPAMQGYPIPAHDMPKTDNDEGVSSDSTGDNEIQSPDAVADEQKREVDEEPELDPYEEHMSWLKENDPETYKSLREDEQTNIEEAKAEAKELFKQKQKEKELARLEEEEKEEANSEEGEVTNVNEGEGEQELDQGQEEKEGDTDDVDNSPSDVVSPVDEDLADLEQAFTESESQFDNATAEKRKAYLSERLPNLSDEQLLTLNTESFSTDEKAIVQQQMDDRAENLEKETALIQRLNEKVKAQAEAKQKQYEAHAQEAFKDRKSFDFTIGENSYRYKLEDASKTLQKQSQGSLESHFTNEDGSFDATGYHRAKFAGLNANNIARHFYEQGRADALKQSAAEAKNIDMRQTSGDFIPEENDSEYSNQPSFIGAPPPKPGKIKVKTV